MFKKEQLWKRILFLGDFFIVALSVYVSLLLRFSFDPYKWFSTALDPFRVFTGASTISIIVVMLVFSLTEMYRIDVNLNRLKQIMRLMMSLLASMIILSFIFYWIPHYRLLRLGQIYMFISMFIVLAAWRYQFFTQVFPRMPRKRVLIMGAGDSGRMMMDAFGIHRDSLYEPVCFLDDNADLHGTEIGGLKVMGDSDRLEECLENQHIETIIVAVKDKIGEKLTRNLLKCKIKGKHIVDASSIYKEISGKIPILHMQDQWFIFGPSFQLAANVWTRRFQRVFDVSVSVIMLLCCSPLMLLAYIAVKLSSPGPAIFRQERVGLNEKPYMLYKFRTMVQDAEKNTGAVWAQQNDPRVTGLGRFLRRSRIDELPQLWNVLKGDMSFIGPRPERAEFVEKLKLRIPYYSLRFIMKPGLTGWAQVNYRYGASEEDALEKLRYELYYLQEMSILLNLLIMVRTVQTVLFHRGS